MFGKNGFQDDVIEIDFYFAQKLFLKERLIKKL